MKKAFNFKTMAIIAFMVICTLPTFGQGGRGQGPGGGREGGGQGGGMGRQWTEEDVKERVKRQTQLLELTEAQEKKLVDFELELYKKNQVERQKLQGDREAMRDYLVKQREVREEKYKEVLTEEQYKKFKENQDQRRKEMQDNRPNSGQPDGDRPARGRGRG
ncbi:MAG: hypothetical protein PF450_08975 [Bacteroidales bacterium]|jgi:Spy/CpxP family protein refolding chaperone|nr:hypothetical protein [Bacteroidales bacterium]